MMNIDRLPNRVPSKFLWLLLIAGTSFFGYASVEHHEVCSPRNTAEIQELIRKARDTSSTITIAGAGKGNSVKTTSIDATVLDQQYMSKVIHIDVANKKITVQPGILWCDLQETVNPFGLAVAAMQSYCDFSVGGTIGVNAHGQDFRFAPIAQTIESMIIVDANGDLQRLSKTENSELFGLVIGGYGLFGVIVEATLQLVDNTMLEKEVRVVDNTSVFGASDALINDNDIALYSARFDMGTDRFMKRMITIAYRDTYEKTNKPLKAIGFLEELRGNALNVLFNAARNYSLLRDYRIAFEQHVVEGAFYTKRSRNNAMFYKAGTLSHSDTEKIEILQEYFVPIEHAEQFIEHARQLLRRYDVEVLNCTLRYVQQDEVSFLPYAPKTVAAFVFYYSIDNNTIGFDCVRQWTRELIDIALKYDARFYLPYYCFATKEQVRSAYPEFDDFIALKKQYDAKEIFVNDLYLNYK